jgi:hypothetical protein
MRQIVLSQNLGESRSLTGVLSVSPLCEFRRLREGLSVFLNELVTIHAADWR